MNKEQEATQGQGDEQEHIRGGSAAEQGHAFGRPAWAPPADFSVVETESSTEEPQYNEKGVRQLSYISAGGLVPSLSWISKEVIESGVGTIRPFARLAGKVTRMWRQLNMVPGQKEPVESVGMEGRFDAVSLVDGEIVESRRAFLPIAWSEKTEEAWKAMGGEVPAPNTEPTQPADPNRSLYMVLTLRCRATNKGVKYAWDILSHMPPKETDSAYSLMKNFALTGRVPAQLGYSGAGRLAAKQSEKEPATIDASSAA